MRYLKVEEYSIFLCIVVVKLLSHVQLFMTPQTVACQGLLSSIISQSLFGFMSIESVMPSNHFILCHPFSSCLQSYPAPGSFPMSQLYVSGGQSTRASASLSNEYSGLISFRIDKLACLLAVQDSSPAPQFESISSLALSLLYGPTLTSIHDYWKNHSFDYMDLDQQSDTSAF